MAASQAETVIEEDDEDLASTPSVLLLPATVEEARQVVSAVDIPSRDVVRTRRVMDRVGDVGAGRRQHCG